MKHRDTGLVAADMSVAGMYLLRRYARAGLVHNRHVESSAPIRLPGTEVAVVPANNPRATWRPMGLTAGE
jgi:hypothetical protein